MSVSQLPIRRVWSGLVTMLWPSMMSLAPPPVTPRRKLPPFLGVPAAGVEPPPLGDDDEPPPPQAARPPASSTPPAPTRSSRRESESRSMSPASGLRMSTIEKLPSSTGEVSHGTMLPPPRGRRDDPPSPPPCQVNDVRYSNASFATRERGKPARSSAWPCPRRRRPRYSGRRPAGGRPSTL